MHFLNLTFFKFNKRLIGSTLNKGAVQSGFNT